MIFDLVKDYADVLEAMPQEHSRRRILKLLDEAIRRDAYFIQRNPTTAFQCLWNTCHWHKDEQNDSIGPSTNCLYDLVVSWRRQKQVATPEWIWCRALLPPKKPLNSGIRFEIEGSALGVTDDGKILIGRQSGHFEDSYCFVDSNSGTIIEDLGVFPIAIPDVRAVSRGGDLIVTRSQTMYRSTAAPCHLAEVDAESLVVAEFDRNTQYLCTGDCEGEIRFFELSAAGDPTLAWNRQIIKGLGVDIALSHDGRLIAAASRDSLQVFNRSGKRVYFYGGYDVFTQLHCVCFSQDGSRLFTGDYEGLCSWNLSADTCSRKLLHTQSGIRRIEASEDGALLALACDDGVAIFDLQRNELQSMLRSHPRGAQRIEFLPKSHRLVTVGNEEAATIVWDGFTGNHNLSPDVTGRGHIGAKAISDDGHFLWLTRAGCGCCFNLTDGRCDDAPAAPHLSYLADCYDTLVATPFDKDVKLITLATTCTERLLSGHQDVVGCVAFAPDGRRMAVGSGGTVRFWDPHKLCEVGDPITLSQGGAHVITWSADGQYIAVLEYNNKSYSVWRSNGSCVIADAKHKVFNQFFTGLSGDGQRIFIGSGATTTGNSIIEVYQLPQGQLMTRMEGRSSQATIQALSQGLPFAPVSFNGAVEIQETQTTVPVLRVPGGYHDFQMSADGLTIACFSYTDVAAFRLEGDTDGRITSSAISESVGSRALNDGKKVESTRRSSSWNTVFPIVTPKAVKEQQSQIYPDSIRPIELPLAMYCAFCVPLVISVQGLIIVYGRGLRDTSLAVQPVLYLFAYLIALPAIVVTAWLTTATKKTSENITRENWPGTFLLGTPATGAIWLFLDGETEMATPLLAILVPVSVMWWIHTKK